ncbi:hypothetical protein IWQ61_005704 [Dispira simplex]|nr:hypothetical protein IWQ61_005704 [Dispira simplex]
MLRATLTVTRGFGTTMRIRGPGMLGQQSRARSTWSIGTTPSLSRTTLLTSSSVRVPRLVPMGLIRGLATDTDPKTTESVEGKEEQPSKPSTPESHEKVVGDVQSHEFKAETRQLLDIVAHSLYSEREVFIRELISNASDALEKLRHAQLISANVAADHSLEIQLFTDADKKTFTIQDFGIGMTKEELVQNLGTIAHSGSKEFLKKLGADAKDQPATAKERIIGQFGVGFYSAFMAGDKLTVYTRSAAPGSKGYCWTSDGLGSYSIAEAEGVSVGTKIIIYLRENAEEFAKAIRVREIIQKYSNFVGFEVKLNGEKVNTVQALWKKNKNEITEEEHLAFYRYLTSAQENYLYHLNYSADVPLSIHSVLYIPDRAYDPFEMGQMKSGVSLYSRNVLIQANSDKILPSWLRFVKGVVDSEDIPLNLSRELLQHGHLIRRLRDTLTGRILRWLEGESKTQPEQFSKFLKSFSLFLKEGIMQDQSNAERIAGLLRFESSAQEDTTSLSEYLGRAPEDQTAIFYHCAPNRETAQESPYLEAFQKRKVEVLFLYEEFDPIVFSQLIKYKGKELVSIDSEQADNLLKKVESTGASESTESQEKTKSETTGTQQKALNSDQLEELKTWLVTTLGSAVKEVKVSERLVSHPAVVLNHHTRAMRQMIKALEQRSGGNFPSMPEMVKLEINPNHAIIRGLFHLKDSNPTLAKEVASQVLDNALLSAGALNDPLTMVPRLNKILESVVIADTPAQPRQEKSDGKSNGNQNESSTPSEPKIPVVEGEKVTE